MVKTQMSQRQWGCHDVNMFCPVLDVLTELRLDLGLSESFLLRKAGTLSALEY